MWFHYLILFVGVPLILVGIAHMYVLESNWLDNDFKLDDSDDIG